MSPRPRLSEKQQKERLRAVESKRKLDHETDLRALMGEPWGRRFVYWLVFELGRLEAPSFDPAIKDGVCAAIHQARNEGFREMASAIMGRLQTETPEQYMAMLAEHIQARQVDLAFKDKNDD